MVSGTSLHRKTDQVTVRNAKGGLIEKDRAKSEDLEPITRRDAGCVALPEATTKFYYRYEH